MLHVVHAHSAVDVTQIVKVNTLLLHKNLLGVYAMYSTLTPYSCDFNCKLPCVTLKNYQSVYISILGERGLCAQPKI